MFDLPLLLEDLLLLALELELLELLLVAGALLTWGLLLTAVRLLLGWLFTCLFELEGLDTLLGLLLFVLVLGEAFVLPE